MARVNTLWVAGFTADTPVMMYDGKTKPISKIKEGERVLSFDPKTRSLQPSKVVGTLSGVINDLLEVTIDDKSYVVASNQRFLTPSGEWKTAPDAEAVLGIDGETKKISAKKAKGNAKIYDITVYETHAFFADGIMVHNGGGGGGSSPPKPPPDPVVTAGKIGKPLTVTVNGNVVTVPASPGSSGQVSVSHTGGVTTAYQSTPGVPANPINPIARVVRNPKPWAGLISYNAVVAASNTRDSVCNSMTNTSGAVSDSTKSSWQGDLRSMRANVNVAKKNDRDANAFGGFTNWTNAAPRTVGFEPWLGGGGGMMPTDPLPPTRASRYDEVLADIRDLERFLGKNKNFTDKDKSFISGKCAELQDTLQGLQNSLSNNGNPIRTPDPNSNPDRIYSNMGGYNYFFTTDNYHYSYQPEGNYNPFTGGPKPEPGYYKHLDTNNGLYYYDKNSNDAIRVYAPD
jgi:hypothetical protein